METTSPQPDPLPVSVIAPVSPAYERVLQVLFRPFELRKWLTLGFCAWLAWLGGSGNGGGGSNWSRSGDDTARDLEAAGDWVQDHLELVIALAVVLVVVVIGLIVLTTWLSSRGRFMFLDGVVRDRGAVVEPWRRFRARANSLFGFRIVLGLTAVVAMSMSIGLMVLSLLAMGIRDADPGLQVFIVLGLWAVVILTLALAFGIVGMILNDFVVPIMWLRDCRVMPAWSELQARLSPNLGALVRYVLFKLVIAIGVLFISCIATCLTCCIAALPYIGTVLLLPLFVFTRSYSMYFLSQLDSGYAAFGPPAPEPPATVQPAEPPPS